MRSVVYAALMMGSIVATASGQPGPRANSRGAEQLEQLIAAAVVGQVVERIGGLPEALAVRETSPPKRLVELDRQTSRNETALIGSREPVQTTLLLSQSAEAGRAMVELKTKIARDFPLVAASQRPDPCTVEQARACLAPDEVALIYVCGRRLCDAIVVKPRADNGSAGVSLIPIPGADEFGEALGIMIDPDALQVREFYERAGADLYRMLIGPVEKQIQGKNLVIIPDGPLALLGFEALRDTTGKFLVESRRIRYAPSITALHSNRIWEAKRHKPVRPFLGIGDPFYTPDDPRRENRLVSPAASANALRLAENLPRLTSGGRGIHEVGRILGEPAEDVWTGLDASETRLKAASSQGRLSDYRYIFISAHARLGSGPARPPALILSLFEVRLDGNHIANDGLLTIGEASALRLNADLVVLSGCHSGVGNLAHGEDVTSLGRAFMSAGARGVLCSLWIVEDTDGTETIVNIFRALAAGQKPAVALREAKLKMIRAGWPPFRWAPLILIGQ